MIACTLTMVSSPTSVDWMLLSAIHMLVPHCIVLDLAAIIINLCDKSTKCNNNLL